MTRRWGIRAFTALAALLAVAAGLGLAEAGAAYKLPKRSVSMPSVRTAVLSNERSLSRWANPRHPGPIFVRPVPGARKIGSVHMRTEDGFPEVYLLLREQFDTHRRVWVELRIPGRPNGRTGWVRRDELRALEITRWLLVVNRHTERITAYHDGRRVFKAPVGIGKPSTPTPAGHFWIRERFRVSDPSSPYWPYALGTSDYSTLSEWPGGGVVGIHGQWDAPQLIPGDPSHGCIRMLNHDIAWLAPRVPVGTPLHVI